MNDVRLHTEAFTQRSLYTEQLLHSDDLTQSGFYTRHFNTQKTLHRAALAEKLLQAETSTQTNPGT